MMEVYGLKLDGQLIAITRADRPPASHEFPIASWNSDNDYEVVVLSDRDLNNLP